MLKNLVKVFLYSSLLFSCSKNSEQPPLLSSEKKISSFIFARADNPTLPSDISGIVDQDTIRVLFPIGTSLANLVPSITITGSSINPANKAPQNFSNLVTYTVKAADGSTKNYFVSSRVSLNTTNDITAFIFRSSDNPSLINNITGTISADSVILKVPPGTNITSLSPFITINGQTITPQSLTAQNFSSVIPYTVTAESGASKIYYVKVVIDAPETTLYINATYSGLSGFGNVYALNPNTGTLKWNLTATSSTLISSVTYQDGILFSGIGKNLTAINTATRGIKWEYIAGGGILSTPAISNGIVFFNCDDGYLYAIYATTGSLKWKYLQDHAGGGNYSSPTIVNGAVYFGGLDGYIYALNESDGTLKWKTWNTYSIGADLQSSPSVINETLYIGDNGHLLALNTVDGSFKWAFNTNGYVFSSPTVVNGTVYFGSYGGDITAVDANTGLLKWRYATGIDISASPIVANGIVYVGQARSNGSNLYAINANTGSLIWSYYHDAILTSSPIVYNNMVYVGSYAEVIAVNATTGLLMWQFTTLQPLEYIGSSPCLINSDNELFLPSISGNKN